MSAALDALNKAIDDLGATAHSVLDKIAEDAQTAAEAHASSDTAGVNAATARIADMSKQLKDQLGALSSSAAAVQFQPSANGLPGAGAGIAGISTAPPTPLAGVPATPQGPGIATGTVAPNTDFVVTETSPNQETSGPSVAPGAETQPGTATANATTAPLAPADQPAAPSPAQAPDFKPPVPGATEEVTPDNAKK